MAGKYNYFNILGVKVSAIAIDDACNFVKGAIADNTKTYVCVCPVSTIMECQKDERMMAVVTRLV